MGDRRSRPAGGLRIGVRGFPGSRLREVLDLDGDPHGCTELTDRTLIFCDVGAAAPDYAGAVDRF